MNDPTAWVANGIELPEGRECTWWIHDGRLWDQPVPDAVELPGRFVISGLVDAHCHLTLRAGDGGPAPATPAQAEQVRTQLRDAGVLALRDTGAHDRTPLSMSLDDNGDVVVRACGRFLSSRNHYFPGVFEAVEPEELVAAAVAEIESGATWTKLVADFPDLSAGAPTMPEPTFDLDVIAAMVDAVHAAGGRVAAHVVTPLVAELVRIGIDSVEHGTALDEPTLEVMAERGTAWTPTLCAVTAPPPTDGPPGAAARRDERIERLRASLPHAARLGVPLLTGSDVVGTVAAEVAALAEFGIAPADAIAAATTTAREFLRLPALTAGARADLVTYDDDPRDDLTVLTRPAAVVAGGRRIR